MNLNDDPFFSRPIDLDEMQINSRCRRWIHSLLASWTEHLPVPFCLILFSSLKKKIGEICLNFFFRKKKNLALIFFSVPESINSAELKYKGNWIDSLKAAILATYKEPAARGALDFCKSQVG